MSYFEKKGRQQINRPTNQTKITIKLKNTNSQIFVWRLLRLRKISQDVEL